MNDPRLKARASTHGEKPHRSARRTDLHHCEIVVRLLRLLFSNVSLPHLIRHIATRGDPVAARPQMLPLIPLPHLHKLRQQLVRTLPLQKLHRPRHRQLRWNPNAPMDLVPIDRPRIDHHLLTPGNLPQPLPRPFPTSPTTTGYRDFVTHTK